MSIDYSLVGGLVVVYDLLCPSCSNGAPSSLIFTQGGKTMWPRYAPAFWTFIDRPYLCDLTLPQNVDSNLFQGCIAFGRGSGFVPVPSLPPAALDRAIAAVNSDRRQFIADPSVAAVNASVAGLIQAGYNVIVDWNGSFLPAIGHVLLAL